MEEASESFIGPQLPINPFVFRQKLSTYDIVKMLVTVFLVPLRVLVIVVNIGVVALACSLGSWGKTQQEMQEMKYNWWRQMIWDYGKLTMKVTACAAGFHFVKKKGKQASVKEAPIIVLAPHSSFLDSVPIFHMDLNTSLVTKGDYYKVPVFGVILTYIKTLFFWREDPNSRQNLITKIRQRSTASDTQAQVVILPEGTCTTRECLLPFKLGAFNPRVPVQPVCIRYPNKLDTVTWTWMGPGVLRQALLTLLQFHINLEMEYLPVYVPSEEEKENPKLYANNVRLYMARVLDLPLTDYGLLDCQLLLKMGVLDFAHRIKEFKRIRNVMQLHDSSIERELLRCWLEGSLEDEFVTIQELGKILGFSTEDPSLQSLFNCLRQEPKDNKIHMDLYMFLLAWMGTAQQCSHACKKMFQVLDVNMKGSITLEDLNLALEKVAPLNSTDISVLYHQLDRYELRQVTAKNVEELICLKPEFIKFFAICYSQLKNAKEANSKLE